MTISMYGVSADVPYDKWPTDALERLKEDLGRNGATTEQSSISATVNSILEERKNSGVHLAADGRHHLPT